tara:strand:- start:701 stop:862 length:162 start_codon:yes stop_codon:yes gene_type:complete
MKTISQQLTQAVRAIVSHEVEIIVNEDNEWFMEQIDNAVRNYLEGNKPDNEEK